MSRRPTRERGQGRLQDAVDYTARATAAIIASNEGRLDPKTHAVILTLGRMRAGVGPVVTIGRRGVGLRARLPRSTAARHLARAGSAGVLKPLGGESFSRTTRWLIELTPEAERVPPSDTPSIRPSIAAIEQHWHPAALGHEARVVWPALEECNTVADIAAVTSLSGSAIKYGLGRLLRSGLLRREGTTSDMRYYRSHHDPNHVCERNGTLAAVRAREEGLEAETAGRSREVARMRASAKVDRATVLRGFDADSPPPHYGESPFAMPWAALYVVTQYVEWLEECGAAVPRRSVPGRTYAQLCREELEAGYAMSDVPLSPVGATGGE